MEVFYMRLKRTLFIGVAALLMSLPLVGCNQPSSGGSSSPTGNMTESYRKGRELYKQITGVDLPVLDNLEVDEEGLSHFNAQSNDICFDIIGGSALNYQTYKVFEDFFKGLFGNCDDGYPSGNEQEGQDDQWTTPEYSWFQAYWDASNTAIYLNYVKMVY